MCQTHHRNPRCGGTKVSRIGPSWSHAAFWQTHYTYPRCGGTKVSRTGPCRGHAAFWQTHHRIPRCGVTKVSRIGPTDGVTPLSGRRITDIHAAVGRKLVASGCRGATPLLHPWRRVMSTEASAMAPWTPHPHENLSDWGPPGTTFRQFFGIPN